MDLILEDLVLHDELRMNQGKWEQIGYHVPPYRQQVAGVAKQPRDRPDGLAPD